MKNTRGRSVTLMLATGGLHMKPITCEKHT